MQPEVHTNDGLRHDFSTRIEALIGEPVVAARRAVGGYSSAQRWIARLESGRSVFAKVGMTLASNQNLRAERAVYTRLSLDCMPTVVAWDDHADHPMLLLADLSMSVWPPPWTHASLDAVLRTIDDMHAERPNLDSYETIHGHWGTGGWWEHVEADPEPFLALGLVSRDWLARSGRVLREAAGLVSPKGDYLCHFDLRSDNVCLGEDGVRIVDWSHACLGNPQVDLGLFLPGVATEGGPVPSEVLPKSPTIAAWVAGFFAHYASKPVIPHAPHVREMQLLHLRAALAWARSELDIL